MELYQSKVFFNPVFHEYDLDGKQLMGVTSLMSKHGLGADYSGISSDVLMKAAERGTAIHHLLEAYDNGEAASLTPELKAYKKLNLNVLCSEYLVSDNRIVASSIDKVIIVDEVTVDLADVKTTSTFHKDAVSIQLSIYKYLFRLANPTIKVRNLLGIHVRDGKAKVIEVADWGADNVEALLDAEANGLPFVERKEEADATQALTEAEVYELITDECSIQQYEALAKAIKDKIADKRERLIEYMQRNHLSEIKADGGVFKLKDAYTTERIDSTRLKAELPDIADKYTKVSRVKASVSFKAGV